MRDPKYQCIATLIKCIGYILAKGSMIPSYVIDVFLRGNSCIQNPHTLQNDQLGRLILTFVLACSSVPLVRFYHRVQVLTAFFTASLYVITSLVGF